MRKFLKTTVVCMGVLTVVNSALAQTDLIVVEKAKRLMTLYWQKKPIAKYHFALGKQPVGKKQKEGDFKTPEGLYFLDYKNPNSAYYKSIHISYPNKQDIANAKKNGWSAGGNVMIHGQKNGYGKYAYFTQKLNWTWGCIALTNDDMDAVWMQVTPPVAILIKP